MTVKNSEALSLTYPLSATSFTVAATSPTKHFSYSSHTKTDIQPIFRNIHKAAIGTAYLDILTDSHPVDIVVDSRDLLAAGGAASDANLWNEVEKLFGAWADRNDLADDWLDQLRNEWDNRLADEYGIDGE